MYYEMFDWLLLEGHDLINLMSVSVMIEKETIGIIRVLQSSTILLVYGDLYIILSFVVIIKTRFAINECQESNKEIE